MPQNIETAAETTRFTTTERVTRALASLPVGRGLKQLAADGFVSDLIADLPLNPQQRRAILPGSAPSLLNSFALLGGVPHEIRMDFFKQIFNRALSPGKRKELPFLAAVLTQAGYWLNATERGRLLVELSQRKPCGASAKCWVALARSAAKISQLHRVLQRCGREKLLQSSSRELKEFVVALEVMSSLRGIRLPDKPSPYATRPAHLLQRAEQLKATLQEAQHILKSMSWAKGTTRYARFVSMLQASNQLVVSHLEGATTPGARNRALRADLERVSLELTFGKSLTHDPTRPWEESELLIVRSALELTGECRNIFSPIFEIKRSQGIEDACAIVSNCGSRIELEDRCFDQTKGGVEVRGGCSPEEVVIHELGHGYSMVPVDDMWRRVRKVGGANVNEWFTADHFPEIFLRIGRWGGITEGFRVDDSRVATIDGERVTLGVPQKVNGELRVYEYSHTNRCLYWYSYPLGEFPHRPDSRADPTEQLTEGFSDYYRAPELLIEHAPNMFWYFESIYHQYDGDQNIFQRLRNRLKSRTAPIPEQIPVEVDAFSLLQRSEQLAVLQKAELLPHRWRAVEPTFDERRSVLMKACARSVRQRTIVKALSSELSQYNPALLMARTRLFAGSDVVIASIRGSSNTEVDTQELLRKELELVLGPRLARENIFLFGDSRRSARFQSDRYHEKLVTFITERCLGRAIRADGQHKPLPKTYERVVLYTDMQPTAEYVKRFATRHQLTEHISVTFPRDTDATVAAKSYLSTVPENEDRSKRTLHIFTLEDVISLPGNFYVRLSGGRIMKELSLKEFLLHPDPEYWIELVARRNSMYRKRDFVFDDSDFTSEAKLANFLKDGREGAVMLKRLAGLRP